MVRKKKVKSEFRRGSVRVCKDTSRLSGLSEGLLIKILSYLPKKVAVSTSILSKQWKFLWMLVPKLEYSNTYDPEESSLKEYIDKNLPSHRAPVLESLRLDISDVEIKPKDIKRWIEIAVSRVVRELDISYYSDNQNIFPSSLFTCKPLVILKFQYMTLMDVPSTVCLPSLKTLQLESVTYKGKESLQRILSICPVLEDLSVNFSGEISDEDMGEFTIIVPSLQRLSLSIDDYWCLEKYVIDTPSLKYFKLVDHNKSEHCCEIKNMPKLRKAYVEVVFFVLKSVLGSITSVKRLTICSQIPKAGGQDDVYGGGFVFNQLQHMNLCVCKKDSSNLLGNLLKDSPNLQVLDISYSKDHGDDERNDMVCWNQPSHVPECLLSCLQIFKWSRYFGRPQDRDIAVYILKNACHLSKATILADTIEYGVPNRKMIEELSLSSRASTNCELIFVKDDYDYETMNN